MNYETIIWTNDNALVFSLPEALREIRALREQKRVMVEALMYVSGHIGGESGERAARALIQIGAIRHWSVG